jgi:hypothetical protein
VYGIRDINTGVGQGAGIGVEWGERGDQIDLANSVYGDHLAWPLVA